MDRGNLADLNASPLNAWCTPKHILNAQENRRSAFVNWARPRTFRCSTIN